MIRFMVVTHEMEERFILKKMCPLWTQKRALISFPYLHRIPSIEEL